MQVLWKKLKEQKVRLRVDTLEDLWTLSNLLSPGDFVYSVTVRRVVDKSKKRPDSGHKEVIKIKLKLEKAEFHKFSNRLRLTGVIESGTPENLIDFGSHHTVNLELGDAIIIEKAWKKYELNIIAKAEKKSPKVVIVALDKDEAVFGLLKDYGVESSTLHVNIPGKDQPDLIAQAEQKFHSQVLSTIQRYEFEKLILCGAGFFKDNFFEYLKQNAKELAPKIMMEHTGSYGENAISEVLKTGLLHKLAQDSKLAHEVEVLQSLLTQISKEGKCVYGFKETEDASNMGAIQTLLITDLLLRSGKASSILSATEKNKGEIVILSTEHETGQQLDGLGGIAALLRFKI